MVKELQGERGVSSDLASHILHGTVLFIISHTVFWFQGSPFYWSSPNLLIFNVMFSLSLLVAIGMINVASSEYLWSLNCKSNLGNWIVQGFLVFVPTQILLIPFSSTMVLVSTFPSGLLIIPGAFLFLGYTVIFGYIGRAVASRYLEEDSYHQTRTRPRVQLFKGTRGRCTFCGESFRYSTHDISSEGTVRCLNCGHAFHLEPTEDLLKKLHVDREESGMGPGPVS